MKRKTTKLISLTAAAITLTSSLTFGAAAAENTLKGDVNRDGVVNITDATIVQQYLAEFDDVKARFESGEYDLEAAKFSGDEVTVGDVTAIQRIAAEFDPQKKYCSIIYGSMLSVSTSLSKLSTEPRVRS